MLHVSAPTLPCRLPMTSQRTVSPSAISWTAPATLDERERLDAWCGTAGPPVIDSRPDSRPARVAARIAEPLGPDELAVVSWNVHAGTGDVEGLVHRLRTGALTGGRPATRFVLLLQESMRAGTVVPAELPAGVRPPRAAGLGGRQTDIVRLAQSLGLSLYYVPSMRNGTPAQTDQDRGNAILSTEPLTEFSAIELPFERQRRVAIGATVSGGHRPGAGWSLRVVSAHLESTVPASRLWVMANGARVRQAKGLLEALGPDPAVLLAGDFNTWLGFADPAYRALDAHLPGIVRGDRRATFRPFFRLDHAFARLPAEWTVAARRLDDRLGSDHYPLLALLRRVTPGNPTAAN